MNIKMKIKSDGHLVMYKVGSISIVCIVERTDELTKQWQPISIYNKEGVIFECYYEPYNIGNGIQVLRTIYRE